MTDRAPGADGQRGALESRSSDKAVAIRAEQLSRRFGEVDAVHDLSIEVPGGTVFGFLGPNGAGKTTTIRMLLGLLKPTSGRAEVFGLDSTSQADEIRARCGVLFEHSGLYERLSAEDNLDFYGRVWRLPGRERRARVEELLRHLGLWERRKDLVGTWSTGMRRQLGIARTLLHHPELVILDEPTSGLDPVAAAAVREDIRTLSAQHERTVLLTTHLMAEAEQLCQQLAVVRDGRLLASGTLDQLRARASDVKLRIRANGVTDGVLAALHARSEVQGAERTADGVCVGLGCNVDAAPLVRLLVESGAAVEEVRRDQGSLEDAYLALMKSP